MPPQELEGETLGQKHREYNAILEKLIKTNTVPNVESDNSDINNLLRIDIASHNRDVEYILNVLKGDDMLYISRALSSSLWLIRDPQYANIINPDYLNTQLFPNMTIKATRKMIKHIRHNLKDETRAESFYLYEKNNSETLKWLPYCSAEFIENNAENHITSDYNNPMTPSLFKRLCEKSNKIFEIILSKLKYYDRQRYLQVVTFFLKTNINKYLDVLEDDDTTYGYPKLNSKATDTIMKHSPKRVIENIEKYVATIHIPTFVKYFSADEIKEFLNTQAHKDLQNSKYFNLKRLFHCDTLKYFIRRLPKNEQFEFAQTVGLNELPIDAAFFRINKLCVTTNTRRYVWYQFAPFEHAFEEITKMIPLAANKHEKLNMLYLLINCADSNLEYIQAILKYYLSKHKTDEVSYKFQFVKEVLSRTQISKYDEIAWNLLIELLTIENLNKSQVQEINSDIVEAIVIYNVLNDKSIPKVIETFFTFTTLKSYKSTMNTEQQNKMFNYLYQYCLSKIKDQITDEKEFSKTIETLQDILKLIRDWEKSFLDYPIILNMIKELINLRKKNAWKISLSPLYNVNKSWRKYMFEESLDLCPNEEVCLNSLKHDPQLLTRHGEEVDALRADDKAYLTRFLAKLRIYWPHSLTQQWSETYLRNIKENKNQKSAVKGLCVILDQKALFEIIEKYKPETAKIDWKQTDDSVVDVQRFLAKYMHLGRPQPIPDAILAYAKGDYLQFALPSLLAIYYNLKTPANKQYIPKLLDSPVSVQKHGIRLAFKTLNRDELKQIFLNCWKNSKNPTIRTLIFKYTFKLLCTENDSANATSLWELLEIFIDNLTFKEDKVTYEELSKVAQVPVNIQAKFLVKSYNFLRKLISTLDQKSASNYKWYCVQLAEHVREVIDTVNPDFVFDLIQDFVENDFLKLDDSSNKFVRTIHSTHGIITVISAYLLHATNENDQIQKYEKCMVPLMQRAFEKWEQTYEGKCIIKQNFQHLLTCLSFDLKNYIFEKNVIVPVKMFSLIQIELEKTLSVPENYMILNQWKLTVALTKLFKQYMSTEENWEEKCGLEFGKICSDYLRKDVSSHFPCIYVLFSKCINNILYKILSEQAILEFYEGLLSDRDFIQGYLCAIEIGQNYYKDEKYDKIWKKVFANASVEVKMHYYFKIDDKKIF